MSPTFAGAIKLRKHHRIAGARIGADDLAHPADLHQPGGDGQAEDDAGCGQNDLEDQAVPGRGGVVEEERDDAGRHEQRYWHEGRWTEHVANGGRRSADAPTPSP